MPLMSKLWRAVPKVQTIVTFILTLLFLLGFGFETPQAKFNRLDQRIDSLRTEINRDQAKWESTDRLVRALSRGDCLDRSPRELQLMDMPCDSLVPNYNAIKP